MEKKKLIFIVIIAIFIIGVAAANASKGDKDDNAANVTTEVKPTETPKNNTVKDEEKNIPTAKPAPDVKTYKTGQYLVGKDIESGLYKVKLVDDIMKMGYVERSKDTNMELESIIANIILTGDGYVEIKNTDAAIKLTGVELTKVDKNKLEVSYKDEINDGIFLVGHDIKPGEYKVEITDTVTNMAYVERAKNVSMGMDDIIANEIFQGQGYVTIKETDFAIRVQGAKLTLQK